MIKYESAWNWNGWTHNFNKDAIPDEQTALAIADILLQKHHENNTAFKLKASKAVFDEAYNAWVVSSEITEWLVDPSNVEIEVAGIVALRKTDGMVLFLS